MSDKINDAIDKLNERISELEKETETIRKFCSTLYDQVDGNREGIAELREFDKIHFRADKDYDLRYQKQLNELKDFSSEQRLTLMALIQLNREVLQGLIEACRHWDNDKIMDRLLAKLDSGGEKELVEFDQVGSIPSAFQGTRRDSALSTDSKPPEPKSFNIRCAECGSEELTHEPREDDAKFKCTICGSYEIIDENDYFRGKVVVKREDLQLLCDIIFRNGFMTFKEKKDYFKIKEEYGIE